MNASFNFITEIPPELPLRLPHLTHIDLSYNKLLELPENLPVFFHLETLILNNNQLTELPSTIHRISKLRKLNLSANKLRELPNNLGALSALERLNVTDNKLKRLPISLGKCDNLVILLASGNRLLEPSQSIGNDSSECINYLKQQYVRQSPARDSMRPHDKNIFARIRGTHFSQSIRNVHSANTLYAESQGEMFQQNRMKAPLLPPSDATSLEVDGLSDRVIGKF